MKLTFKLVHSPIVKRTDGRTKINLRSVVTVTEGLLYTRSGFLFSKSRQKRQEQTGAHHGRF